MQEWPSLPQRLSARASFNCPMSELCGLNGAGPSNQSSSLAASDKGASPHTYYLHVCAHCRDYCQGYSSSSKTVTYCWLLLERWRRGDAEAEFVFVCMNVTRTQRISPETSERCRHSGYGLSCHGNCSRCGLSGSKEERRDDLERFGEKRKLRKKERQREGTLLPRRCFVWRCCSSVTTTMFSLHLLTILLSPLTEAEWNLVHLFKTVLESSFKALVLAFQCCGFVTVL